MARSEDKSKSGSLSSSESNPAWLRYEQALKATGYFRDYMDGSKPYQQLMLKAKVFFDGNLNTTQHNGESHTDLIVRDLRNLIQTTTFNLEELKQESSSLSSDDGYSYFPDRINF